MTVAAALFLAFAGFVGLALAMQRHQRDLLGRTLGPARTRAFRIAGWTLIAASLVPMALDWGMLVGLALWLALLSFAALANVIAILVRAGR